MTSSADSNPSNRRLGSNPVGADSRRLRIHGVDRTWREKQWLPVLPVEDVVGRDALGQFFDEQITRVAGMGQLDDHRQDDNACP